MKQTRRPEDEEQLNKTPETPAAADAPQEEPAYSLEEIMNEFGGWTKRDAPAPAEPVTDETVRLAVPAAEAKGEEKPAEPPAGGDTIRFTPVEEEKAPEPERPAVWTYRGEPDPERPAPDPKEARELARAERREKRQAEKRRRQLERFQKKEARKKRAQEQPEHTFASPEAAYAFYAAASGTRLRLLVSTLLCLGSVLLLVLSTPLITGAFSDHAAVFSAAMLGLLLLQAVCSYDVCLSGVIALLRFRFDQYSMLFLALCAVVADAFFAVAEGRTPFCTVAGILLLLALWGRDLLYDARRRSLRAISNMDEPVAAIREEKAWHGYDCIFRAPRRRGAVRRAAGNAGRGQPHYARLGAGDDGGDARAVRPDVAAHGRALPLGLVGHAARKLPGRDPDRLRQAVFRAGPAALPRGRGHCRLAGRADLVR